MHLETYICELLFRYNCVVVPGFGAFLSHEKAASHHEKTNTFYPPTKLISFNAQLEVGDGILVSHIAACLLKSYEDTLLLLQYEVKKWKHALENGEALDLEGLGVLSFSKEGKISFNPLHSANYLAASFGLSPVKAIPAASNIKEEISAISEPIVFRLETENKNKSYNRLILKYAAAGLIGVSSLLSAYKSYDLHLENKTIALEEAQEVVSKKIQEATFFGNNPLAFSPLEISLPKKEIAQPSFFIIAGAFRAPENASKKIAALKEKGFENASYLGANRWGLHQVSYGAFVSENEARVFLLEVQKNHAKDAWLLVSKK